MMVLFLLVEMRLVAFGSLIGHVDFFVVLARMLRCKSWSGEECAEQNRHDNSLHRADGSMRPLNADRKPAAWNQEMNGHGSPARCSMEAMKAEFTPDGDDGDGGGDDGAAARKRTPDLRTSSTAELPQVFSSWFES